MNSNDLIKMKVPAISDVSHINGLNDAFDNINKNFEILANHEFVQGARGDSVKVIETSFFNEDGSYTSFIKKDGTETTYYEELKKCINEAFSTNPSVLDPITLCKKPYNVFSYFDTNPGELKLICNISNNDNSNEPVGSLCYIFLDGRFNNINVGKATDEELASFNGLSDASCVLVFDNKLEGFKRLDNAFPTVYYEKHIGLCWKINGNNTGLPIQGIPGKNGENALLRIVKGEVKDNKLVVTKVFESYEGYLDINEYYINELNDNSAIILREYVDINEGLEQQRNPNMSFYFGKLTKEDDMLVAYCDVENPVNRAFIEEDVINAMKNIDLLSEYSPSTGMKGLFIPIERYKENKSQSVHILTASSITNEIGLTNDVKNDLLFTPINDINNVHISSDDLDTSGNNILKVDKYLYLKLDKIHNNIFSKYKDTTSNSIKDVNDNINDIDLLKYKLYSVIISKDSETLNIAKKYGNIFDSNENKLIKLNESNTVFPNNTDEKDTFPKAFKDAFDAGKEIYCWELCDESHAFDVKDFKNNYNVSNNIFKNIFTTTVTPSIDTEIMWFNAVETYNASESIIVNDTKKYIIPGWSYSSAVHNVFDFIKFTPVYNKSDELKVLKDTALNINYNVNIGGDTINPTKNLTIHGDVTSNAISTESITANIYNTITTSDDIIGEKGLKLNNFEVYNGIVNADSGNFSNELKSKTLNIKNDISEVSIKEVNNISNFDVSLKNINNIDITGNFTSKEKSNIKTSDYSSLINSDVTVRLYNGSNLVISNKDDIDNVYIKNYVDTSFNGAIQYYESNKNLLDKTVNSNLETINGLSTNKDENSLYNYTFNGSLDENTNNVIINTLNYKNISDYINDENVDVEMIEKLAIQSFTIPKELHIDIEENPDSGEGEIIPPVENIIHGTKKYPIHLNFYISPKSGYDAYAKSTNIYLTMTASKYNGDDERFIRKYDLPQSLYGEAYIKTDEVIFDDANNYSQLFGKYPIAISNGSVIEGKTVVATGIRDLSEYISDLYWSIIMTTKQAGSGYTELNVDGIYYQINSLNYGDVADDYFNDINSIHISTIEEYINEYNINPNNNLNSTPEDNQPGTNDSKEYKYALDINSNITINFDETNSYFTSCLSVLSKSLNGNWPKLGPDSFMNLELAYSYIKDNKKYIKYIKNVGKYTFDNIGKDLISSDENINKIYTDYTRNIFYEFLPNNITISYSECSELYNMFSDEKKLNDNRYDVQLLIIPVFQIDIKSDINLFKGLTILHPYNSGSAKGDAIKNKLTLISNQTIPNKYLNTGTLNYYYYDSTNVESSIIKLKHTTICNDGILFNFGNTLFGLGILNDTPTLYCGSKSKPISELLN